MASLNPQEVYVECEGNVYQQKQDLMEPRGKVGGCVMLEVVEKRSRGQDSGVAMKMK